MSAASPCPNGVWNHGRGCSCLYRSSTNPGSAESPRLDLTAFDLARDPRDDFLVGADGFCPSCERPGSDGYCEHCSPSCGECGEEVESFDQSLCERCREREDDDWDDD